jgi:hypothetical protein
MNPDKVTPEVLDYELDRFTDFLSSVPSAVIQSHPKAMEVLEARGWLRRAAGLAPLPSVDLPPVTT